jgi:hypothetical protein
MECGGNDTALALAVKSQSGVAAAALQNDAILGCNLLLVSRFQTIDASLLHRTGLWEDPRPGNLDRIDAILLHFS